MKIQDGCHSQTCQNKASQYGPIEILVSTQLFKHLKHQNKSTSDNFIHSSEILYLVPFLATKKAMVPHANDSIMLGRSIWLLRHLECQNLSIMSDSIGIPRWLPENGKK